MAKKASKPSFLSRTQRVMITGLITLVPIWITWVIFAFIFDQLSGFGKPVAEFLYSLVGPEAEWLNSDAVVTILSILLTLFDARKRSFS